MAAASKGMTRPGQAPNAGDVGARIGDAILGFIGNVPSSARRKSKSAEADARQAIATAAARASLAAGTLSLPPGPFGWLTMLPELVAVWKIQAQLVADIAALHGRKSVLTREAMLYCLFRHTAAQALRDIVVQAGAQILVKPATIHLLQKIARSIGIKIGQRALGHLIHVLDLEGRSSSGRNGRAIHDWMQAQASALKGAIVIAYSKGATDFMHAAVLDADERRWIGRVDALVTVAGVVNGTPLASPWAEWLETLLEGIDVPTCGAGDGGGVDSQTYAQATAARDAYLAIASRPPTYAVAAVTDEAGVNPLLAPFHRQLREHDVRNDGQVLFEDAVLPGSHLLAIADADHWSIALPFETSSLAMRVLAGNNHFPRVALVMAILDFVAAGEAGMSLSSPSSPRPGPHA